jgi:uncharacterized protein YqeY
MLSEKIRIDMQNARRAKDTLKANLLSALYGELINLSKSGKEFNQDDEIRLIRKFIKNIDETLALDISEENRTKFNLERRILEEYLPAQLSEHEIREIVKTLAAEGKVMKDIMSYFKENYTGRYDGKTVSEIVKQMI